MQRGGVGQQTLQEGTKEDTHSSFTFHQKFFFLLLFLYQLMLKNTDLFYKNSTISVV